MSAIAPTRCTVCDRGKPRWTAWTLLDDTTAGRQLECSLCGHVLARERRRASIPDAPEASDASRWARFRARVGI